MENPIKHLDGCETLARSNKSSYDVARERIDRHLPDAMEGIYHREIIAVIPIDELFKSLIGRCIDIYHRLVRMAT
jgi:hypothetical protein